VTDAVLVPAYRKPKQLRDTTVAWLTRCGWAPERTFILVPDDDDLRAHAAVLPGMWARQLIVTAPGLVNSRQLAKDRLLADGLRVVWVNDDVSDLRRTCDGKTSHSVTLQEVAEAGWQASALVGAHLWGVYAALNPYFMKPGLVRTDLRHIVGCFYGEVVRKDPGLTLKYGDAKEDYERTLRHWKKDRALVRFDDVAPRTRYYNRDRGEPIGGRFATRTPEAVMDNVLSLQQEFGGLVRINERRAGPWLEILIGG
jgi:hypothetical protein